MDNIEINKVQNSKIIKTKQQIILLQLNHKEMKVLLVIIDKIIIIDKIEIQDSKEVSEIVIVITIGNVWHLNYFLKKNVIYMLRLIK